MTIYIKPELEALIQERLQNGPFHDVDELLTKALEALPGKSHGSSLTRETANGNRQFDWREMRGMARGTDSLTQSLTKERAAEKEHDDARIQGH